jgi:hypothetical protein
MTRARCASWVPPRIDSAALVARLVIERSASLVEFLTVWLSWSMRLAIELEPADT